MNTIIQSLMKKRRTPKRLMCGKHNVRLTATPMSGGTSGVKGHTRQGRLRDQRVKKVCLECVKEEENSKATKA